MEPIDPWASALTRLSKVPGVRLPADLGFLKPRQRLAPYANDPDKISISSNSMRGFLDVLTAVVTSLRSRGFEYIVGVPKKGMALVRTIATKVQIQDKFILDSRKLATYTLKGEKILLVDDSVHDGDTFLELHRQLVVAGAADVVFLNFLASNHGLGQVSRNTAPAALHVMTILPVEEAEFGDYFVLAEVPLLAILPGGTISNRPHIQFTLQPKNGGDYNDVATCFVQALAKHPLTTSVTILPPLDGIPGPVIHGKAKLKEIKLSELGLPDNDGLSVSQVKLRFFVSNDQPSQVYLYGILWLKGRPDGSTTETDQYEVSGSEALLKKYLDALKAELGAAGVVIESSQLRLP